MLIKEYRIPMPMSVEEYRIAQLYMIQVRSQHQILTHTHLAENSQVVQKPGDQIAVCPIMKWLVTRSDVSGVMEQRELVCR